MEYIDERERRERSNIHDDLSLSTWSPEKRIKQRISASRSPIFSRNNIDTARANVHGTFNKGLGRALVSTEDPQLTTHQRRLYKSLHDEQ
jgi:hypothetical protein